MAATISARRIKACFVPELLFTLFTACYGIYQAANRQQCKNFRQIQCLDLSFINNLTLSLMCLLTVFSPVSYVVSTIYLAGNRQTAQGWHTNFRSTAQRVFFAALVSACKQPIRKKTCQLS